MSSPVQAVECPNQEVKARLCTLAVALMEVMSQPGKEHAFVQIFWQKFAIDIDGKQIRITSKED